jgi:hypothetical protein
MPQGSALPGSRRWKGLLPRADNEEIIGDNLLVVKFVSIVVIQT